MFSAVVSNATMSVPQKQTSGCGPGVPRTFFLKCITFVPHSVAWIERWRQVQLYGNESKLPTTFLSKLINTMGGKDAVDKIPDEFHASEKTIKQQLKEITRD